MNYLVTVLSFFIYSSAIGSEFFATPDVKLLNWQPDEFVIRAHFIVHGANITRLRTDGIRGVVKIENDFGTSTATLEKPSLRGIPPTRDGEISSLINFVGMATEGNISLEKCPQSCPVHITGEFTFASPGQSATRVVSLFDSDFTLTLRSDP